jgi:DNA-binding LytR/AlgR family response regulator
MLRIKVGHKERLINVSSISYLESSLHKVSVHTRTGVFETYAKLDDLQAQLPTSFARCHRSFLVNLVYVTSVDEGELRLYDGTVVPVSRRRAKQMQRSMLAYLASRS